MKWILPLIFTSFINYSYSQGYPDYESGLKVKINESGSKYFRLMTWHQLWLKYNENNTGSTLAGQSEKDALDLSIRSSRVMMYAQLSDRFLILTHFGMNNQTTYNGGAPGMGGKKPQLFMHDAYVEYKVWKNYLSVGSGLHFWNGISRMSSSSTVNFLAIDAPIFNWPNVDANDQFARYIGIYAKGKIKRFDYRLSVNDAFQANPTKNITTNVADYNPHARWNAAGYVYYQFFDEESNFLPFMTGTYLGSKKVLNVGAGFQHQNKAMWSQNISGDTSYHQQLLLGFDVFMDLPLSKERKDAITFYGVYYKYDMGKNFVRNLGILNPADGGGSLRGNAVPLIGTGSILFGQIGYLIPEFSTKIRLQPYVTYSHAQFEGVRDIHNKIVPVNIFDAGLNLYAAGHHAKWTVNYRLRPDFTNVNQLRNRNEVTLQLMVYL